MQLASSKFSCDFCDCLVVDCQSSCDGIHTGIYPEFPGNHRVQMRVKNIGRFYLDIHLDMGQELIIPSRLVNEYSVVNFAVFNLDTGMPVYRSGQCSRGETCYTANVIRPIFLGKLDKLYVDPCNTTPPLVGGIPGSSGSGLCPP